MKYLRIAIPIAFFILFLLPAVSVATPWTPVGFSWGDVRFTIQGKTSNNVSFINMGEYTYAILHGKKMVLALREGKTVGMRVFYYKGDLMPIICNSKTKKGTTRIFNVKDGLICVESVLGGYNPFERNNYD